MQKVLSNLGEFGLINLIKRQTLKSSSVICGIGDDAAVVPASSKKYTLLTTDMLIEDVHFTRGMGAKKIGHKAMAVNVSDIAAMGGLAQYALVSLGVPPSCPVQFISQIYQGMKAIAKKFNIVIVGGDTVRGEKIIINVALVGQVKKSDVVYRCGARVGDQIFVTGPLGKSLSSGRHLTFVPRVREAQYLVKNVKPNAMIDISDGLAADLGHILTESRVGAVIEQGLIPKQPRADLKAALHDGEDFELLFTLSSSKAKKLQSQKKFLFYPIGEITSKAKGFQLKAADGSLTEIKEKGYTHF